MTDGLAKIDLANAAEKLKDKIHFDFVQLIPEEQWKALLQAEFKKFLEPTVEGQGYNQRVIPSKLQVLCHNTLSTIFAEKIRELLSRADKPILDGKTVQDMIEAWLDANRATLMAEFFNGMMSQVIAQGVQQAVWAFKAEMQR